MIALCLFTSGSSFGLSLSSEFKNWDTDQIFVRDGLLFSIADGSLTSLLSSLSVSHAVEHDGEANWLHLESSPMLALGELMSVRLRTRWGESESLSECDRSPSLSASLRGWKLKFESSSSTLIIFSRSFVASSPVSEIGNFSITYKNVIVKIDYLLMIV